MSDLDYTLISYRCLFCGQVTDQYWFVDKSRGECRCNACLSSGIAETQEEKNKLLAYRFNPSYAQVSAGKSAEVSFQDTADGRVSLSKAHKSPREGIDVGFVEWASGAGLLKVSKGGEGKLIGGGKRGKIQGFSFASRRRLMYTIAKIKLDAELPDFVTLTYPNEFPSPSESKRHLDIYLKRLLRFFPDIGLIWKLEPQERGAPHYHMLAWGVQTHDLFLFTIKNWYEIAGNGDQKHLAFHMGAFGNRMCVEKVLSRKGVMRYASKYLGKTFEVAGWDETWTGRYWAVVNRENIPFGQEMIMYITQQDAKTWMRYQRRFSGIRSRVYSSLTTFSDAEQWISNIIRTKDNG